MISWMKKILLVIGLLSTWISSYAQFITASLVENWKLQGLPGDDYNLNAAYVFLINPQALKTTFEGENLQRSEKKEIGLKKGDFPRYMYLAVNIPNPMEYGEKITIPLMIQDMRNPNQMSRVTGYGGRVLENIPDAVLAEGDITASIQFEAIKDNNTVEFWQKTAKISIDLGKTATSLVANPLAGGIFTLTQQIIPQVSKGLNSLQAVEQPEKISSEFFIKLLNQELSEDYKEKVVGANLYKIHWDADKPSRTRLIRKDAYPNVQAVKDEITLSKTPFILVVQSKSAFTPNHNQLKISEEYLNNSKNELTKIHNEQVKELERDFLVCIEQALYVKEEVDLFKRSLNARYTDWLAYAKGLNGLLKLYRYAHVFSNVPDYKRWFQTLESEVRLWFDNPLLVQGLTMTDLLNRPQQVNENLQDLGKAYDQIKLFDFFRSKMEVLKIGGALPEELEQMEINQRINKLLFRSETAVFEKGFQLPSYLSEGERQIEWLKEELNEMYPLCQYCSEKVTDLTIAIRRAKFLENQRKFRALNNDFYDRLACLETLGILIEEYLEGQNENPNAPESVLSGINDDSRQFKNFIKEYAVIVNKDASILEDQELVAQLDAYRNNRIALESIIRKLENIVFTNEQSSCFWSIRP